MAQIIKKLVVMPLLLLLFVIALLFFLNNKQAVTLDYLVADTELSLALLMLASLGVGIVLGGLAWLPKFFLMWRKNQQLKKQTKHSEHKLNKLRTVKDKF